MNNSRIRLSVLLMIVAFSTGCPRNQYVIEMKPAGPAMERNLTCWREDGVDTQGNPNFLDFPPDELGQIARLFTRQGMIGKKHQFSGRFEGELPKDMSGQGSYTVFPSGLGTAYVYVERFRGGDDVRKTMDERLKAADQLVNLTLGWSREALGSEPGYEKLRRFLDSDFRNDLRNIVLYWWLGGVAESRKTNGTEESVVRMAQYLAERGYWSARDLPAVLGNEDDPKALLALVQRLVATKLGTPPGEKVGKSLAVFSDPAALKASFEKYLRGTTEFQARTKEWERKGKPENETPDPLDIAGDLVGLALQPPVGEGGDRLTVKLSLPAAPARTNGKWDEPSQQVIWQANMESQTPFRDLPAICYAQWGVPDEEKQKQHFGKAILKGVDLVDYCFWFAGLAPEHAQQWSSFLSSLQPGNAQEKIKEFRFVSSAGARNDADPASPARQIFARLLKE